MKHLSFVRSSEKHREAQPPAKPIGSGGLRPRAPATVLDARAFLGEQDGNRQPVDGRSPPPGQRKPDPARPVDPFHNLCDNSYPLYAPQYPDGVNECDGPQRPSSR